MAISTLRGERLPSRWRRVRALSVSAQVIRAMRSGLRAAGAVIDWKNRLNVTTEAGEKKFHE
jgi:hypothetical protein